MVSPDGSEARIELRDPDEGEQLLVWRDGLRISAAAGPVFDAGTDATARIPISVLSAIVDSLASVPADDPRLVERAFDEDTVEHP